MFCSLKMPHWWLLLLWVELETEWIPDSLCITLESKYIHYEESEKVSGSYLSVFPDRSGTFAKSISIHMRQSRTEPQALTRPVTIWATQAQGSLSLEADWGQKTDAEGLPAEGTMWQTKCRHFHSSSRQGSSWNLALDLGTAIFCTQKVWFIHVSSPLSETTENKQPILRETGSHS